MWCPSRQTQRIQPSWSTLLFTKVGTICCRGWSASERKQLAELQKQRTKASTNKQYAPYWRLWKVGNASCVQPDS